MASIVTIHAWNLTLRDSMDHHLVPVSKTRLRIVRHLTAAAADTHTWHHLEQRYRSTEQIRGWGYSYQIGRLNFYPVPNV